jgi:hypothetical protein
MRYNNGPLATLCHVVYATLGLTLATADASSIFIAINNDMAAKRRKMHKNKISGLVISKCYNEQKSKF